MKISASTKIASIIQHNPEAIDVIASINKHFEKLKNPILRKVLASRVTIRDAARIGKTTEAVFFQKLSPLGFESNEEEAVGSDAKTTQQSAIQEEEIVAELDVREDIRNNNDPFNKIMQAFKKVPEGKAMKLINSFEPVPLLNLLKEKGHTCAVTEKAGVFEVVIIKGEKENSISLKENLPSNDFETLRKQFENHTEIVDVRDLEMPQPMVTILETLEKMPPEKALFVHHKRVPKFLLPELESRGFMYAINKIDETDVQLIIYNTNTCRD